MDINYLESTFLNLASIPECLDSGRFLKVNIDIPASTDQDISIDTLKLGIKNKAIETARLTKLIEHGTTPTTHFVGYLSSVEGLEVGQRLFIPTVAEDGLSQYGTGTVKIISEIGALLPGTGYYVGWHAEADTTGADVLSSLDYPVYILPEYTDIDFIGIQVVRPFINKIGTHNLVPIIATVKEIYSYPDDVPYPTISINLAMSSITGIETTDINKANINLWFYYRK